MSILSLNYLSNTMLIIAQGVAQADLYLIVALRFLKERKNHLATRLHFQPTRPSIWMKVPFRLNNFNIWTLYTMYMYIEHCTEKLDCIFSTD